LLCLSIVNRVALKLEQAFFMFTLPIDWILIETSSGNSLVERPIQNLKYLLTI
jgi:hypothetical protein